MILKRYFLYALITLTSTPLTPITSPIPPTGQLSSTIYSPSSIRSQPTPPSPHRMVSASFSQSGTRLYPVIPITNSTPPAQDSFRYLFAEQNPSTPHPSPITPITPILTLNTLSPTGWLPLPLRRAGPVHAPS